MPIKKTRYHEFAADIEGAGPLFGALQDLPHEFQREVVLPGMRKGGQHIRNVIKGKAPVKSGELQASIEVEDMPVSKTKLFVGVTIRAKARHAAAQEFGFRPHKKGGAWSRKIPGKRYMRGGLHVSRHKAFALAVVEFAQELPRTIRRIQLMNDMKG